MALPGAYAPASIAILVTEARKPAHHDEAAVLEEAYAVPLWHVWHMALPGAYSPAIIAVLVTEARKPAHHDEAAVLEEAYAVLVDQNICKCRKLVC
jgi:hypothetical protein